jgi:hypothetical protein
MYLVMSRLATYCRGDFAVDFRSYSKEECEDMMKAYANTDRHLGNPTRERILVKIEIHLNP